MTARRVLVNLVLEFLTFCLQRVDECLLFNDIDIFIVRVAVNQQGRGEFIGIRDW